VNSVDSQNHKSQNTFPKKHPVPVFKPSNILGRSLIPGVAKEDGLASNTQLIAPSQSSTPVYDYSRIPEPVRDRRWP